MAPLFLLNIYNILIFPHFVTGLSLTPGRLFGQHEGTTTLGSVRATGSPNYERPARLSCWVFFFQLLSSA